jgi:hypothetical protein
MIIVLKSINSIDSLQCMEEPDHISQELKRHNYISRVMELYGAPHMLCWSFIMVVHLQHLLLAAVASMCRRGVNAQTVYSVSQCFGEVILHAGSMLAYDSRDDDSRETQGFQKPRKSMLAYLEANMMPTAH